MKKTFKELEKIDEIHAKLLLKEGFKKTKLAYAFKRFTEKNIVEIFTEFNESNQGIRIENALVDEKTKALLYKVDGQNFQYGKEGLKNVIKELNINRKEWDSKEFEVTPFICKEPLDETLGLEDDEIELLTGVII